MAFFHLIETQVLPALIYTSEIWWVREVKKKKVEQVDMYACKKVLYDLWRTGRAPTVYNTNLSESS